MIQFEAADRPMDAGAGHDSFEKSVWLTENELTLR